VTGEGESDATGEGERDATGEGERDVKPCAREGQCIGWAGGRGGIRTGRGVRRSASVGWLGAGRRLMRIKSLLSHNVECTGVTINTPTSAGIK
jgi:hypothetical protein